MGCVRRRLPNVRRTYCYRLLDRKYVPDSCCIQWMVPIERQKNKSVLVWKKLEGIAVVSIYHGKCEQYKYSFVISRFKVSYNRHKIIRSSVDRRSMHNESDLFSYIQYKYEYWGWPESHRIHHHFFGGTKIEIFCQNVYASQIFRFIIFFKSRLSTFRLNFVHVWSLS